MIHIRIEPRQEFGRPAPLPNDVPARSAVSRGIDYPFFTALYEHDVALMSVQQNDNDSSALLVCGSLAFNFFRVFGPSPPGEPLILSQQKSSNWDVRFLYLGWNSNTHKGRISLPLEKPERLSESIDD